MRPPWGQRRALFPTEDTGLHRVGLLLRRKKRNSKWFVSVVRLFHVEEKNNKSAGSCEEEIIGEYLQKAFQWRILNYHHRGNQICVPVRCKNYSHT